MRLLSKNSRETKNGKPTVLGDEARAEAMQHQIESTQAIGQRYETIHGGLDSIGRVMEHLKAIEPLIAEIRGPVSQEFEARRAEHAELIAVRANLDQAQRQIALIQAEEREVSARLAAAETALGESDARRQTQDAALEDNALEIDRLRNALLQSDLKVSSLDASLRDATARIEHLVQDVEGLRVQAQDIDARRGDAEAALARANQDNALLGEEAATLKKRVDQAGLDLARLSRIETDLEAQLAAERARVQAVENALAAHQADSGRTIRGLESQVEANRAEIDLRSADAPGDRYGSRRQAGRDERPDRSRPVSPTPAPSRRRWNAAPAISMSPWSAPSTVSGPWRKRLTACASVTPASTPPAPRPSNAPTSWPRALWRKKRPSSGPRNGLSSYAPASMRCRKRKTRFAAITRRRSPSCRRPSSA